MTPKSKHPPHSTAPAPMPAIPLTFDRVFKSVFASPDSQGLLEDMLNAILKDDLHHPLDGLSFLPQEYQSTRPAGGSSVRMDVVAMDRHGRVIDIEAQRNRDDQYVERLTLYVSHLVTHYTDEGRKERGIREVLCLSLGLHPLPGLEGCTAPIVRVRNTVDQEGYTLKGRLPLTVHVNLTEARRQYGALAPEDFDECKRWCYYLAMEGEMTADGNLERIHQLMDENPRIAEAHKRYLKSLGGDNEALKLGLLRDWYHEMKDAGELATARADGENEGREKGLTEGRREGIEQGKLDTARAMKADNMTTEVIARYTGLCKEQIERL